MSAQPTHDYLQVSYGMRRKQRHRTDPHLPQSMYQISPVHVILARANLHEGFGTYIACVFSKQGALSCCTSLKSQNSTVQLNVVFSVCLLHSRAELIVSIVQSEQMLHEVALAMNCTHIGTYHVHVVVNSNDIVLVLCCKSL